MDIEEWLGPRGGIALRSDAVRAGFTPTALASARVSTVARRWIASDAASPELLLAARERAVLGCVTAAAHRGLAMLIEPGAPHLWAPPSAHLPPPIGTRRHPSAAMLPPVRGVLIESVPDMLAHVAECLPHAEALVVWESAIRKQHIGRHELSRYRWSHVSARRLAAEAGDGSDSLLETLAADLLRHAGIAFRQQVKLLGHRVDLLVGDRLVVQLDGFGFHGGEQRRRDLEHDARLQLAGYAVLRFAYADVVGRPEHLLTLVRRHLALLAAGGRAAGA